MTIPNPPLRCTVPSVVTGQVTPIGRTEATARCTTRYSFEYGPPGALTRTSPVTEVPGGGTPTEVTA